MIIEKTFLQRSAFFAKLSNYAYKPVDVIRQEFSLYDVKYYSNRGSDVYVLSDNYDVIIVCRGTEIKQKSDVIADLNMRRSRFTQGKVHKGFYNYVNHIWHPVLEHAQQAKKEFRTLWIAGHSLGGAMATILAERFARLESCQTPTAIFTYGSPRVGNRQFINHFNSLPFVHHRWVNDGDIVTKVPMAPLFYHCGIMHHIDAQGEITLNYERQKSIMGLVRLFTGRYFINQLLGDVKDHSSDLYSMHLHASIL